MGADDGGFTMIAVKVIAVLLVSLGLALVAGRFVRFGTGGQP